MHLDLSFGPFAFDLTSPVTSPLLDAFVADGEGERLRVEVRVQQGRYGENGSAAIRSAEAGVVRIDGPAFDLEIDEPSHVARINVEPECAEVGLLSALGALVTWHATGVGLAVMHASAVRCEGGVAALLAPSRGGKSTAAREAPGREFAYNGLLVRDDGTCWPLPFTGRDDPPLRSSESSQLVWGVLLHKAPVASHRMINPQDATNDALRRVVVLKNDIRAAAAIGTVLRIIPQLRWALVEKPLGFDVSTLMDSLTEGATVR